MNTENHSIYKKDKISIEELIEYIGRTSFFYFLFIITFITSIPSPAWGFGTSTIPGGLLTFFISIQILLNFKHIYMPEFIKRRQIKTKHLKKIMKYLDTFKSDKSNDYIFKNKLINKLSAILMIPCSFLMMVPLILTNWAPSFGITLLSISHILKNQLFLFFSYLFIAFIFVFYFFALKYLINLFINAKDKLNNNDENEYQPNPL